jgi:SAM-dependent methyltransferase
VWEKYQTILQGQILDVGADECHLRQRLGVPESYTGIGLGGKPDIEFDLEQGALPFADRSFDCVLCLDVLEHVDDIHGLFDELCRVSRQYVVVALPNAWVALYRRLTKGDRPEDQPLRLYGLPLERPVDRHKWFFSAEEATNFILSRSAKNGFRTVQVDDFPPTKRRRPSLQGLVRETARRFLFRAPCDPRNLTVSTVWAVLERCEAWGGTGQQPPATR